MTTGTVQHAQQATSGTWGIPGPIRRALKSTVLELRALVEDDYRRQLTGLGFREEGVATLGRALSEDEQRVRDVAVVVIARETAAGASHGAALAAFIRDSAFTFLNRAVGLRCLDERSLLLVDGQPETAIKRDPTRGASSLYWRARNALPGATPRELWREVFRRAGDAISERVRVLFDPDGEYAALFPLQATVLLVADALNTPEIPPQTYAEDEALGWVYQYYGAREKDAAYAKLAKGKKLETPEELAAATCLYTERYMVDYLLQNTLGALWVELHPKSRLPERWPYFVKPQAGEAGDGRAVTPRRLRTITLLDPACGSGHFLVRAFDLLVEMYREEAQLEGRAVPSDEEIAHAILENNLHGIDIDLRAVQLAALALYLKACTLAGPHFQPRQINLVAADAVLPGDGPPAEYIARFAHDPEVQTLIDSVWQGLRNVRELGSLLHPERRVDEALERRREAERKKDPLGVAARSDAEWAQLKHHLLESLRAEFETQSQSADLGQRLFGEHAARGVSLVEALGRRYDVVVMNPPYAGSKNLSERLKKFVEKEYKAGKRDLYAAFILRCREFARSGGHVGMVTQQSWMFLRSFAELRKDVLEQTALTTLAHLGPRAFEEIGGEVVNIALFTLQCTPAHPERRFAAFRLIGPKSPVEKDALLTTSVAAPEVTGVSTVRQLDLLPIPETPFVYWLKPRYFELLRSTRRIRNVADVRQGLITGDNDRFTRCFWEVGQFGTVRNNAPASGRWFWYAKGGGYQKWAGLEWLVVDWANRGEEIKNFYGSNGRLASRPQSEAYYFRPAVTSTLMSRGSMGARLFSGGIFGADCPTLFTKDQSLWSRTALAAFLSTRSVSYLLRMTTQSLKFREGYVAQVPLPESPPTTFEWCGGICVDVKQRLVATEPVERSFSLVPLERSSKCGLPWNVSQVLLDIAAFQAVIHSTEGMNEQLAVDGFNLGDGDVSQLVDETGTPAGWHPLIVGYDTLLQAPEDVTLPTELGEELGAHDRVVLAPEALARIKTRLRTLYQAGAGAKVADEGDEEAALTGEDEGEGGVAPGASIPIPAETFLEELSQKLEIHPISVYWLLEELRQEDGLVSPPEVKRQVEDYVSVSILRLLGYRWPEQDAYEKVNGPILPPETVDEDGIIPLVTCRERQPTAEQRVVARLEHNFGEDGAAKSLTEFKQFVGRDLGDWLRRDFFRRHIQQFKQRPIAWHVVSPGRTFEALVLYHRLGQGTLQRLRTQYAGGLIERLRADQERARERGAADEASALQEKIEDVEEFRSRLERIERGDELRARIRCRWKDEEANGRPGPYAPDIDDGVKVNIRPFQEMGLLAVKEVIKKW